MIAIFATVLFSFAIGAIVPPPWADPKINPCAVLPRGWQMLYWPHDGQCYKIFKMGHPCPSTMELTPGKPGSGISSECKCPPGTIRTESLKVCYPIFSRGPCQHGEYFAPNSTNSFSRIGACTRPMPCPDPTQVFWPPDGKCYRKYGRGPCPRGKLLTVQSDGIANCTCDKASSHVWEGDGNCYEHYAKGPCERGMIFLPEGRCGCGPDLPHYHSDSDSCYEIGSVGPCRNGHRFTMTGMSNRAKCQCKPNYELWIDGSCYRLYTKGPCAGDELFAPPARCVPLPCRRSRLYFPDEKRCFKIGTQGPCKHEQVVIFDFEARPSIDGVAYNGVCGCANALSIDSPDGCGVGRMADSDCQDTPGMVVLDATCHMLYTKGPCKDGQWLVPSRKNSTVTNADKAECVCKPSFTRHRDQSDRDVCLPPSVSLARYLNEKYNRG